ncbi:MAG: hypothetical protein V1913_18745 [Fibrobacterota bacterium]
MARRPDRRAWFMKFTEKNMPKYKGPYRSRSLRLSSGDYAPAGGYFVTVCVKDKRCVFGDVADDAVRLTPSGEAAEACWRAIPEHFPDVSLDEFVVMPDHVHGIIVIERRAAAGAEERVGRARRARRARRVRVRRATKFCGF